MLDILDRIGMAEFKFCSTPVDTNSKVAAAEGALCLMLQTFTALLELFTT